MRHGNFHGQLDGSRICHCSIHGSMLLHIHVWRLVCNTMQGHNYGHLLFFLVCWHFGQHQSSSEIPAVFILQWLANCLTRFNHICIITSGFISRTLCTSNYSLIPWDFIDMEALLKGLSRPIYLSAHIQKAPNINIYSAQLKKSWARGASCCCDLLNGVTAPVLQQ